MRKLFIFFFLFLISSISISYGNTNYELKDKISKNLRCIVCQGQSIYDSQSEFAESVKLIIEKKNRFRKFGGRNLCIFQRKIRRLGFI